VLTSLANREVACHVAQSGARVEAFKPSEPNAHSGRQE
jgi:hypothetical protein